MNLEWDIKRARATSLGDEVAQERSRAEGERAHLESLVEEVERERARIDGL